MDPAALISYEEAKNRAFESILHRQSSKTECAVTAILQKDSQAHAAASKAYFKYWDNKKAEDETDAIRQARADNYAALTRQYYNLATDFFEFAWSQSFHFCRFAPNETFSQAIARHEHNLADALAVSESMEVLDVGCGVGGPAREIARVTGARITGLNINEYQLQRARKYTEREGLSGSVSFVQGDFMNMPFPDNSFDVVYAIEATFHAPSLRGVYSEMLRVLKPGGIAGIYEWLMTDEYDDESIEHRKIRLDIERGVGIAHMSTIPDGVAAMEAAGFTLHCHHDLAACEVEEDQTVPWYRPLDGSLRSGCSARQQLGTGGDLLSFARTSKWGRAAMRVMFSALESICLAPSGTYKTAESLAMAADAMVEGGKRRLFTPMYLMVGSKSEG